MNVLFLCTGNSCRSQMAEGIGRRLVRADIEVFSAGTSPVGVHPRALEVLAETGVDTAGLRSKGLDEVPSAPDLVVTLCPDAATRCSPFPAPTEVLHMPVDDPAGAKGTDEEVLDVFRSARDEIERRLSTLFEERRLLGAS